MFLIWINIFSFLSFSYLWSAVTLATYQYGPKVSQTRILNKIYSLSWKQARLHYFQGASFLLVFCS